MTDKNIEARAIINNKQVLIVRGGIHPFKEGEQLDANPPQFYSPSGISSPTSLTHEDLEYLTSEALRLMRQRNPCEYVDKYEITIRID